MKVVIKTVIGGVMLFCITGCVLPQKPSLTIPAEKYARRLQRNEKPAHSFTIPTEITEQDLLKEGGDQQRAQMIPTSEENSLLQTKERNQMFQEANTLNQDKGREDIQNSVYKHQTYSPYKSKLQYGEPGVEASLWKEGRGANDIFHDYRAWQPMDLVTIVITENAEGQKGANTRMNTQSTIEAAIRNLFGLESTLTSTNRQVSPSALINGEISKEFQSQGETLRRDRLKATISAMVAEVLPSGILRIEGEKIISMNNEEQIMIISGLVRPRDVNSDNEVLSSKIANMRIDYYGNGPLGNNQSPGWLTRIIDFIWPL
jgi:flagellar L-ring protein FlgH